MFSKKPRPSDVTEPSAVAQEAIVVPDDKKKGPTPKRRDAEAANKVPLVPDDRKAAARASREESRRQRDLEYKAMQSGDERHLPLRDKGPQRRFVRDWVDARWNLGEIFLFIALGMLVVLMLVGNTQNVVLIGYTTMFLYAVVLLTIADGWLLWRKLKKALRVKFGEDFNAKPLRWYAVMRAFQIRRARLPKPMVKHGQFPV